jgi:ATP-dependent Clp protease protease subunit
MNRNFNEFESYYKNHLGMSGSVLDSYMKRPRMSMTSTVVGKDGSQSDVFTKLIEKRIIYLGDALYDDVANVIKAQLLYLNEIGDEDIKLFIDSPGGSIYTSYGIIDTMDFIDCDVSTVNTGMAASMGAILLCYGTPGKRKSLKRARTMIHQPLGGVIGQATEIEITSKEINKLKKELAVIISDKSGQDIKKVLEDMDRDYWMTAKEAKKYGLIDTIL